jgi:hypothetical protein
MQNTALSVSGHIVQAQSYSNSAMLSIISKLVSDEVISYSDAIIYEANIDPRYTRSFL